MTTAALKERLRGGVITVKIDRGPHGAKCMVSWRILERSLPSARQGAIQKVGSNALSAWLSDMRSRGSCTSACIVELAFAPEASCTDPVGACIAWHCRQGRHSEDHLPLVEGSGGCPALAPSSGEYRLNGKREFRFHIQPITAARTGRHSVTVVIRSPKLRQRNSVMELQHADLYLCITHASSSMGLYGCSHK